MAVKDTSAAYKRVRKIKDQKFSVDNLQHYSLTLQIGINDLQVAVIDSEDNRCVGLEDYRMRGTKTINGRLRLIKSILDDHEYLTAGFWKDVKLLIKSHKFSLVPNHFFIAESAADYLALNSEIKTSFEVVKYYKQLSFPSYVIFASEEKLCKWIESIYEKKKVHVIHQSSAILEGILNHQDLVSDRSMYCYLDRGILHIVVTDEKKLQYYNQFAVRVKDDLLKYIMLVINELDLDNKRSQVFIWGFIKQDSEEMKMLKKYIRNISLGSKPSFLKYGFQFDEIPDHQYFDVLSGYLCD